MSGFANLTAEDRAWAATAAAHASVSTVLDNSGEAYKDWAVGQIGTAQGLVKASRWLAALAVAAVLASALLLWFGKDKPSPPTVIDATGSAVCAGGSGTASSSVKGVAYVVRCNP